MLALFPEGFEEREVEDGIELAAYTDAAGEERMRRVFGTVRTEAVEAGWEDRWREFHRGARVGRLWVGPPWEAPPPGLAAVIIEPGRAFGTGSHATTRLCLELLCELTPTALMDLGCGSGVLAMAGARLGFEPVTAVDVDPLAVEAARENARTNGVELRVLEADVLTQDLPPAPTVVANLTLAAVQALAPRVPGSTLVTSGYLAADAVRLARRRRAARRELDGWAADVWMPAQ